jgi:hypothetical protein
MGFLSGLLIGVGGAIVLVPFGFYIYNKIKETYIRRDVKKMINNNQFLVPIDPKDFDTNMWKDKIDTSKSEKELEEFNDKMFKKGKFKTND